MIVVFLQLVETVFEVSLAQVVDLFRFIPLLLNEVILMVQLDSFIHALSEDVALLLSVVWVLVI